MPRYCAVKLCHNKGGLPSKGNKRISFYPFPLHDEARLRKWTVNMKRGEWTPSRHQYLCSEHFTEDSFDLRWGIRYLKHTAVPTIFPYLCDTKTGRVHSTKNARHREKSPDISVHHTSTLPPPRKKLLLLKQPNTVDRELDHELTAGVGELMPSAAASFPDHTNMKSSLSESTACDSIADLPSSSRVLLTEPCIPLGPEEQELHVDAGSPSTLLCGDTTISLKKLKEGSHNVQQQPNTVKSSHTALTQAATVFKSEKNRGLADTYCELVMDVPGEEASSLLEHSYSRQDTDKDQLWSRIAYLHTKITALEKQEEFTVAKIKCMEMEIEQLKKRNAVCLDRQKVLEDYFTSVFLYHDELQ